MVHQLPSGFLVSSSLKLSSLDRCRTTRESIQLPLINFPLSTKCMMRFNQAKSLRSQRMVASVSECIWKVPDGTQRVITLMSQSQNSFIQNSHLSGSCQRRTEKCLIQGSTNAPYIRSYHVLELFLPRVIPPISASLLNYQAEKKKINGLEQGSLVSCLSDTELASIQATTLSKRCA